MSGRVTYNPATGRCQWAQYSASPGRALYKGFPIVIVRVPGVQVRGWVPDGMYYARQWFALPELQMEWYAPRPPQITGSMYDTEANWYGSYTIPGSTSAQVRYCLLRSQNNGVDGWLLRLFADESAGSGGWAGVLDLWRAGSEQAGTYEYMASSYDPADFSFEGPYSVAYKRS